MKILSVTACHIQPQLIYSFMIFWVESSAWHLLVSCFTYSSTLKMKAICSSETSVDFHRTTQRYNPKYPMLHGHGCENLRSNIFIYGSWNDAVSISDCITPDDRMVSELEKIWKEASKRFAALENLEESWTSEELGTISDRIWSLQLKSHCEINHSAVGVATGYGLDDGESEFESW
jgi:hypothetical protein